MESKNIRIATSGIYDYAYEELDSLGLTLPCGAQKKKIYKVYRPAIVMEKSKDKFKMLPLTHHHPAVPVDDVNFRDLVIGYTGDTVWVDHLDNRDEVGIRATCVLYDSEALDAYERGEIQLSAGYHAVFDWAKGTAPDGQDYDIIMKDIISVNHVALLPLGRGGSDASIMDGAPEGNDNASKDHVKKNDTYRKEIKEVLKESLHKDLLNESTGIKAQLAMEGVNKMSSGAAITKSINNGFTAEQHFEAVKKIVSLFNKAKLVKEHGDLKHGTSTVRIKRFVAEDKFSNGTPFDALITVKESEQYGHRIYSLELDEIKKASLRWQVNKDVTLFTQESTTGSPTNKITHDTEKIKSIFEIYQGDIFEIAKAL